MRRNPWLVVLYTALFLSIAAALIAEVVAGDGWRSFWLAVSLGCLLCVKDDLMRQP